MASVALVVLDTLRYDTFREHFDWLPGRHFSRAYATSHWTVPAHASLFTGRYASEVGVYGHAADLDCPAVTLAEALADAGHRTRAFTANPQLWQYDGWDRGFDEFVGPDSIACYGPGAFDWGRCFRELSATGVRRYLAAIGRCLRADCATLPSLRQGYELYRRSPADGGAAATLERVRATEFGDEAFLFVNLMETHTPYHPPAAGEDPITVVAADVFTDEPLDLDRARRAYERSAAYLAERYRELFAALREDFEYVVTVGDHGELFGEHGMVNHSFGLYPELTHVPLVVSGDGVADDAAAADATADDATADDATATDDGVVSLLDVHRTVAELAGVSVDSRGRHLLGERDPTDVRVEYHGPLPFHDAQFGRKDVPEIEYERRDEPLSGFAAATGGYAYETHTEGFRARGEFDADPRARLDELDAEIEAREVGDGEPGVADDVRERLETLGYA